MGTDNPVLKIFFMLLLSIAGFAAGAFYGRHTSELEQSLYRKIAGLERENLSLTTRNKNIQDTLSVVKRQLQTDRIAYTALQETVSRSTAERARLQEQLEEQRMLLQEIREKLPAE